MSDPRVSIGLAIIALALAIATVVDVAGDDPAPPTTTRVIPELSSSLPARIELSRGGEAIVLERSEERWHIRAPIEVPADPAAVRALIGTAEMLSYRRREVGRGADPALGLDAPRARLELRWPDGEVARLAVGNDAGGAGTWIARGGAGDALLVPSYAAAELGPELTTLRAKRIVPAADPDAIEVAVGEARGRLSIAPPSIAIAGGAARADAASLWRSLRAVEIQRFVERPSQPGPAMTIRIVHGGASTEVAVDGRCGGDALHVIAPVGAGCVPAEAIEALRAIATAPETLVDRSAVLGGELESVALGAGEARVELAIGDAERDGARTWRAALEAAVEGELAPAPKGEPVAIAEVTTAGAAPQRLRLYRAGQRLLLRRGDEPVALVAGPGARALLEPAAASRFRDLTLLAVDPSTVRQIRWIRGGDEVASWRRGELLEDWRDAEGRAIEPAVYEPVLAAVAPLRAERGAASMAPGEPTILEVTVAPAGRDAEATRHRFEIASCTAREVGSDAAFVLDDETCAALAPPAS